VLLINSALFVMLVAGAFYARDHGLIGLALLWVVVTPLYLLVTLYLSRKAFPVSLSELLRAVWPASLAVCAMVVAIVAFETFMPGATTLLRLVLDVLLGALVYGSVLLLAFPQRVAVIRQQLFGQRGSAA
jgi:hypothetical protein